MATGSKFPSDWNLSPTAIAYLQTIESRFPSNTTPVDGAATLATLIARFNVLLNDLNKK